METPSFDRRARHVVVRGGTCHPQGSTQRDDEGQLMCSHDGGPEVSLVARSPAALLSLLPGNYSTPECPEHICRTDSIVPKVHVSAIIRGLVGGRGMMRARPTHALLLLCVFRAGKEAAGVCDTPPCSTVRDNLKALFDDLVNGEITFYLHRENSLWLRLVVHIHYKNA